MYRARFHVQVKYGHFKDYFTICEQLNELARSRGWAESTPSARPPDALVQPRLAGDEAADDRLALQAPGPTSTLALAGRWSALGRTQPDGPYGSGVSGYPPVPEGEEAWPCTSGGAET